MAIEKLKSLIPDYAKDIKLNLSSLSSDETLSPQQLWGTFLACALAGRNRVTIIEIEEEAGNHLSAEAVFAAKAAASIMSMTNIYYRFTGMVDDTYKKMPARLRMNILAKPGVDKADFELWSLAVSTINGCQYCIKSHEQKLRNSGFSQEQIQLAVRIAATVHAVSAVIEGEQAIQSADAESSKAA